MDKKIIIGVIVSLVLIVVVVGGNYLYEMYTYKQIVSEIRLSDVDLAKVADGVYKGEFDAKVIGAEVKVSVKDQRIVNVELIEHKTDRGEPAEVIIHDVVKKQSVKIDTISGATNSSKVILKAVQNALEKGKKG